jgi:hypothetical protein
MCGNEMVSTLEAEYLKRNPGVKSVKRTVNGKELPKGEPIPLSGGALGKVAGEGLARQAISKGLFDKQKPGRNKQASQQTSKVSKSPIKGGAGGKRSSILAGGRQEASLGRKTLLGA